MTTILVTFVLSLLASLALTPLSGRIGIRLGAMDAPDERKMHTKPMPRIGGMAMFLAFWVSILLVRLLGTDVSRMLVPDLKSIYVSAGCLVVFGIGLADDFYRLGPKVKFLCQIFGASLAYLGGFRIGVLDWFHPLVSEAVAYGLTVLWFVMIINAINLVDGLDGLAGGVALFSCLVMFILSVIGERYYPAMLYAALSGGIIGFLVFNFHPASIFMGDSGSYFLGYCIAAISLIGSTKTQTSATLLLPLVSLGVPVFETILSPIRRFIRGRKMFNPDKEHAHHRLIKMGLNTRRAVLMMYSISIGLCLAAVLIVQLHDKQAGLFLVIIGVVTVIIVRKLGYFDYVNGRRIVGWLQDIGEEVGINIERRRFLDIQIDIGRAKTVTEMWQHVSRALEWLSFDFAEMKMNSENGACTEVTEGQQHNDGEVFQWSRNGFDRYNHICETCLMKMELPLLIDQPETDFGTFWLVKDLRADPITHYTLKRVEHLRRSMISWLRSKNRADQDVPVSGSIHADSNKPVLIEAIAPVNGFESALRREGMGVTACHDPASLPSDDQTKDDGKSKQVLVVDDEVTVLMDFEERLTQIGFDVKTAITSDEALHLAAVTKFDLAILDIGLPGMNGIFLCAELREMQPGIRVIAVTGQPSKFESHTCLEAGFNGYFVKPVDIRAIVGAVAANGRTLDRGRLA